MAVHHSSIATLKQCPQKFKYAYADRLERKRESLQLKRGSWLHFMLQVDTLRRGLEHGSLLVVPEEIEFPGQREFETLSVVTDEDGGPVLLRVTSEEERFVAEFPLTGRGALDLLTVQWEWLPADAQDELTEGDQTLPEACWNLYRSYKFHYRKVTPTERPLLVEFEWERTADYGPTRVKYAGRVDEVYKDHRGLVIVRDWKTTKSEPGALFRLLERQRLLYAWGLEHILAEHDLVVAGLELDYLLTVTPTVPRQNQPKKPKKPTKANPEPEQPTPNELKGELSKAKINTTPFVYMEALRNAGLEITPEHRDKINELDAINKFFARHPIPYNKKALAVTLRENGQVAALGEQILRAPGVAYRNESRSCQYLCDFSSLCLGELYGQDVSTIKRNEYQERVNLPLLGEEDDDE